VDLFVGFMREARLEAEKVPLDQDLEIETQAGVVAALCGGISYAAKAITRVKNDLLACCGIMCMFPWCKRR